jgi:hypothetical protein
MSCLGIARAQHLFDYVYILFKNGRIVFHKLLKTQEIILAQYLLRKIGNAG